MRASIVTIAKLNGADDSQIMQQSRQRTRTMIDRYTRVQQVVRHHARIKLGLGGRTSGAAGVGSRHWVN